MDNKGSTESPFEDPDVFCSQEVLDSNIRFKVLQLRASDKKPFCLMSMIPSRSTEIPENLQQVPSSLYLLTHFKTKIHHHLLDFEDGRGRIFESIAPVARR